jgi:glycine/D-amino acid oxidase-like deaminating enzyme
VATGGDVTLCEEGTPLGLTSSASTECYRNWWPSAEMVGLVDRSIDLMEGLAERTDNAIGLNRRGYLYVTAETDRIDRLLSDGRAAERHGAGPLRVHEHPDDYAPHDLEGFSGGLTGADLLIGDSLARHFPYLATDAVAGLHARRAGWLSANRLGSVMLESAREDGLVLRRGRVSRVETTDGRVSGIRLSSGEVMTADRVVLAAGPLLPPFLPEGPPMRSELHRKLAFRDTQGAVPRNAPMLIWVDPLAVDWDADEVRALEDTGRPHLVGPLPGVCHGRPEGRGGSPWVLGQWEHEREIVEPEWPIPPDPIYPELVLRGMARMVPRLGAYRDTLPRPVVDGGYYTKTPDNRPVIGPVGPDGLFVCGALSGFGIMAGAAAGELACAHVTGTELPSYAPAFHPSRFSTAEWSAIEETDSGQL